MPRPKLVYDWSVDNVLTWLVRHCGEEIYLHYADLFRWHDMKGRALIRLDDNKLRRMGITNPEHNDTIWREILKLILKMDIIELRDMQRMSEDKF